MGGEPALKLRRESDAPPVAESPMPSRPQIVADPDGWIRLAELASHWPEGSGAGGREKAAVRHAGDLKEKAGSQFAEKRAGEWWLSPFALMPGGESVADFVSVVLGRAPSRLCGLPLGPNQQRDWENWGDAKRRRVLAKFQLVARRDEHAASNRELSAGERKARFNAEAREFAGGLGLGGISDLARAADNFRRAILKDRDPDPRGRPRGGAFVPAPALAELCAGIALDPNDIGLASAIRLVRHEAKRLGLPNPSKKTWERWFNDPDRGYPKAAQVWCHKGSRRGEAQCVPKVRRNLAEAEPFEVVELDGHKLDIMHRAVSIQHGWRLRREAVLCLAIDVRTLAVAWDLRGSECSEGVASCLYDLLTRYGRPKKLRTDNGRAVDKAAGERIRRATYDNEEIGGVCAQLGIVREGPPPYRPWSKGVVERFARIVKDEFSRWFASFWGGFPAERPEGRDREVRADIMGQPTLDDLRAGFGRWVEEEHMTRPRETMGLGGLSPRLALEQLRSRIERVPERVAFMVCALKEAKERRYGRDGVTVDGWIYRVPDAARHIKLEMSKVWVRRPPKTGDYVLICEAGGAVVAEARRVQLASVSASTEDLREIAREQARSRRELSQYRRASRFDLKTRGQQLAELKAAEARAREAEVRAQLPAAASPEVVIVRADLAVKAGSLRKTGTDGTGRGELLPGDEQSSGRRRGLERLIERGHEDEARELLGGPEPTRGERFARYNRKLDAMEHRSVSPMTQDEAIEFLRDTPSEPPPTRTHLELWEAFGPPGVADERVGFDFGESDSGPSAAEQLAGLDFGESETAPDVDARPGQGGNDA